MFGNTIQEIIFLEISKINIIIYCIFWNVFFRHFLLKRALLINSINLKDTLFVRSFHLNGTCYALMCVPG